MKIDVFIRLMSAALGGGGRGRASLRSRSRSVMSFRSGADMCDLLDLGHDIFGEIDVHLLHRFLLASLLTALGLVGENRVPRAPCLGEDHALRQVEWRNRRC